VSFVANLKKFAAQHDVVNVGSAYAGCDILFKTLTTLSATYQDMYGISLVFKTVWLAEHDPRKAAFLEQQFQPRLLVSDFQSMLGDFCKDSRTGASCAIPETHVLVGGFPCVQKSPLNPSASSHRACIQQGVGPTGAGFARVVSFAVHHNVPIVILENVKIDVGDDDSETRHMKREFNSKGYAFHMVRFDAQNYGSAVTRDRTYFVAWKGAVDVEARYSCSSLASHLHRTTDQPFFLSVSGLDSFKCCRAHPMLTYSKNLTCTRRQNL
jgi:site-specific DNA-cytosine methylase